MPALELGAVHAAVESVVAARVDAALVPVNKEKAALQEENAALQELFAQGQTAMEQLHALSEQCDALRPLLDQILNNEENKLSDEQQEGLRKFLAFSLHAASDAQAGNEGEAKADDQKEEEAEEAEEEKSEGGKEGKEGDEGDEGEGSDEGESEEDEQSRSAQDAEEAELTVPFTDEVDVSKEVEHWHQRVAPVKPTTNNRRVQQPDPFNPGSVVVTGLRFNIQVDQASATPTFHIDSESPDTDLLRIHFGAPYQDVCYRIPSKAWAKDHEFKHLLVDGLFQLHFNFQT